jgi:hypothetical protein
LKLPVYTVDEEKSFSPVGNHQGPHLRRPNPEFNPGFTPTFIIEMGGESWVEPRVWPPEMWAQINDNKYNVGMVGNYLPV